MNEIGTVSKGVFYSFKTKPNNKHSTKKIKFILYSFLAFLCTFVCLLFIVHRDYYSHYFNSANSTGIK